MTVAVPTSEAIRCIATRSSIIATSRVRNNPRKARFRPVHGLNQVRVLGNIGNQIRVVLSKDLRMCAPDQQSALRLRGEPFWTREPTSISTDVYGTDGHKYKESNMRASDSLFCFASNKIEIHPCPNCRAPMLVRINPAGLDLCVRTFECFNCDTVVVVPGDQSGLSF